MYFYVSHCTTGPGPELRSMQTFLMERLLGLRSWREGVYKGRLSGRWEGQNEAKKGQDIATFKEGKEQIIGMGQ